MKIDEANLIKNEKKRKHLLNLDIFKRARKKSKERVHTQL